MLKATVRFNRADGAPEVFFYEAGQLMCYARIGEHSTASSAYYVQCTRPARTEGERKRARALFDFWNTDGAARLVGSLRHA